MIWIDSGAEIPETEQIIRYCKDKYNWNILITEPLKPAKESIRLENTGIEKHAFAIYNYEKPRWKIMDERDLKLMFWGLRNEESTPRKINYYTRGITYWNNYEKAWVCNPLSFWKWQEIFSYLYHYSLPVHPLYNNEKIQTLVENRGRIRVNTLAYLDMVARYGCVAQIRAANPQAYQILLDIMPEMKEYA